MGGVGGDVGKCVGVWGEVRKDVWGGCGRVYGVSGEVCRHVGKGCGEGNGGFDHNSNLITIVCEV